MKDQEQFKNGQHSDHGDMAEVEPSVSQALKQPWLPVSVNQLNLAGFQRESLFVIR